MTNLLPFLTASYYRIKTHALFHSFVISCHLKFSRDKKVTMSQILDRTNKKQTLKIELKITGLRNNLLSLLTSSYYRIEADNLFRSSL